jgi:citrate lyase subunit beta/citryl-CoA lyase
MVNDESSWSARARAIAAREEGRSRGMPARHAVQTVHLTVPATRWSMVEGAVRRSRASLVLVDLEDSVPQGDDALLEQGRNQAVRALRELDWGDKLRFFRPRGLALDPDFDDLAHVMRGAGDRLEGIVVPKVEHPDEVRLVDEVLTSLEREQGLAVGQVCMEVLIESVSAEERAFEIAGASERIVGLVFGAYDYWSSLRMGFEPYRFDHPATVGARLRIAKAAASVGVAAIAEMTTLYPTKDKSEQERRDALEACRRDALFARSLGMAGKWVGHPAQVDVVLDAFAPTREQIERALRAVRAYAIAIGEGRGAVMIEGEMADRATDRVHRTTLAMARSMGLLGDEELPPPLG